MDILHYKDVNRFMFHTAVRSLDEALEIADKLVSEKLAECVNVVNNVLSVYWWKGKKHTEPEVLLIIKGFSTTRQKALDRLYQIHPYDKPHIECIK